jgi:hypothetical protein
MRGLELCQSHHVLRYPLGMGRPCENSSGALFGVRALGIFGAFSVVCTALFGCAEPKVSLSAGPREYVPSDYAQVLNTWTRDKTLVELADLDSNLSVTATFESWDFRWAYVVRYAADYRLTVAQRSELLDRTLGDTKTDHEFYVTIAGSEWRWADLSRPTSAWIVRLIDDQGNETAPSKIESIVKPGPLEQQYFPYTNVWRHAFRVRFPRYAGDGRPTIARDAAWFGLLFAGAEGNEELIWRVAPGAQDRRGS